MDTGRSFHAPTPLLSTQRSYTAFGSSPSSVASLTLTVEVRDLTLTIEVASGTQTFKWLALHATDLYAQAHAHLIGGETFTPVNLTDAAGNALYPSEVICEKVDNGDQLRLELVGPKLGLNSPNFKRERSLWELYAYSSQDPGRSALVPLVFLFDASELALSAPPALFGNFNSWGVPITMQWWKGNLYKHQMEFPAHAEIVFKFVVGSSSILTPHIYPIVHDSQGNKLHYIRVAPIPPLPCLDSSNLTPAPTEPVDSNSVVTPKKRVFTLKEIIDLNQRSQTEYLATSKLLRNGTELPVLSARLVGSYPGSKVARTDVRAADRLARRDWNDLKSRLGDIFPPVKMENGVKVPTKLYAVRIAELQQVVLKYHDELSQLFSYYGSGTPGCSVKGATWNLIKFMQFINLIKIPDARATPARIDKIYFQAISGAGSGSAAVGGDIPLNSREIKSHNNSIGKLLLHQEDPFSTLNQMTRTHFCAALIRVAMLRYKNPASLADYDRSDAKDGDATIGAATSASTAPATKKLDGSAAASKDKSPPPPAQLADPNPALSLELLIKLHLQPFSIAMAQSNSIAYAPTNSNPNELRLRCIGDANVFSILEQYSSELQRLFLHYTGGAPASGLSLGVGAAAGLGLGGVGIIGGSNGAAIAGLPPTLMGQSISAGGLLSTMMPHGSNSAGGGGVGHHANGAVRQTNRPIASATIHMRELDIMLHDYELLDPALPRGRSLMNLGLVHEDGVGIVGISGLSGGSLHAHATEDNTNGNDTALELLYPEWIELLVRIADTGSQWSNLYIEQQRLIAAAIAAGTLNPLDKPPASMMLTQSALLVDDDVDDDGVVRRLDETELCERFLRLIQWIFPSEADQRQRRAKLAAHQNAQATPQNTTQAQNNTQAAPKEAPKEEPTKESAKGKGKVAASKTPIKKPTTAKK